MYVHDLLHRLLSTDVIERRLAHHQLIRQNSNAPLVHSHIVFDSLQNLRSRVVKCPAVGLPPLVADRSPSEIAKLTDSLS